MTCPCQKRSAKIQVKHAACVSVWDESDESLLRAQDVVPKGFAVGQLVACRNSGAWRSGFVTSVSPLLVTASQLDPSSTGFEWKEVRTLTSEDVGAVGDGARRWNGTRFITAAEDKLAPQLAKEQQLMADWKASGKSNDATPFSIRVSSITGGAELEVTAQQTVEELRRLIQKELGTAPDQQKLRLEGGGAVDNDALPLGACGVQEGSVIHLTVGDPAEARERRRVRALIDAQ